MKNILAQNLIQAIIKILKQNNKSDDISSLLMEIEVEEPSLLKDFLIELSLSANTNEETGVGCYSIEHIEKAFEEFKNTGDTDLLNVSK